MDTEIEIKLRVTDADGLRVRIASIGALPHGTVTQTDTLYEADFVRFYEKDQVLRLRMEQEGDMTRGILTFKGAPTFSVQGHKIRDEFETRVDDPVQMRKILSSLGFVDADVLQKTRERFVWNGLRIELDTLSFGTFVELEGDPEMIEQARDALGLHDVDAVRESYIELQHAAKG